jgi:hypothetical protein
MNLWRQPVSQGGLDFVGFERDNDQKIANAERETLPLKHVWCTSPQS